MERSVPIMSSQWPICIFKSSTSLAHRSSVLQQTIRCGLDLAAAAKPRTPVILLCYTTSWRIAGCFRNSLHPLHICSVWRCHRRTIRPELITVGPFWSAVALILGIIRRLGCGQMPITSARESLQVAARLSVWARMRWIAARLSLVTPTRRSSRSLRRRTQHTWLAMACCRAISMARHCRLPEALTISWVQRTTMAPTVRRRTH